MARYAANLGTIGLALLVSAAISACGYRFRGQAKLPFDSVYVVTGGYNSFSAEMKRFLSSGNKTTVRESAEDAQVTLEILSEEQSKQILSLSAGGRVREFELIYVLRFRLSDRMKQEWIAPTDLTLRRDFTFDDQALLAKESEEANLLRDMRNDALSMMLRRLSMARAPGA